MTTTCICCENDIIVQNDMTQFVQERYNLNLTVQEIFQKKLLNMSSERYICSSCDILLLNGNFPAHILHDQLKCFFCEEVPTNTFHGYNKNVYKNTVLCDQLEHNDMTIGEESIICDKCHKFLMNKYKVKCLLCERMTQKKRNICV